MMGSFLAGSTEAPGVYEFQAVKQGFQDLGADSLQAAHELLRSGTLRLEVCTYIYVIFSNFILKLGLFKKLVARSSLDMARFETEPSQLDSVRK
ncbi:putative IMP dehydrogenase [Helianthus annuus]|nr:putative IMP dehydrogenase [Helianthus annuus]